MFGSGTRFDQKAVMETQRLHPNLAQIAAAYDDITEQHARHLLTDQQAYQRIAALVARDDQGVQWCISPNDGQWYRRTRAGQLVRDTPPAWGVATLTAYDLSEGDPFADPRRRVWRAEVDPASLQGQGLAGATIVAAQQSSVSSAAAPGPWKKVALAVVVALMAVVAYVGLGGDDTPGDGTGATTTVPAGPAVTGPAETTPPAQAP